MGKATDNKEPTEFPLDLTEFCRRLSQSDSRVELIGAFHSNQVRVGFMRGTESEYRKRFAEFCGKPIN